jgi:hypothetical protein
LGKLESLLDLYDERATLECNCELVTLTDRESIAAYWSPKLQRRTYSAFTLDEIILTDYGLMVDYRGYDGKAARIHFHFDPSGKILHTSCRLLAIAEPSPVRGNHRRARNDTHVRASVRDVLI